MDGHVGPTGFRRDRNVRNPWWLLLYLGGAQSHLNDEWDLVAQPPPQT